MATVPGVPQYQGWVDQSPDKRAPPDYQEINAPSAAFGTTSAAALKGLGEAGEKAGGDFLDTATKIQTMVDEADANNRVLAVNSQISAAREKFQTENQGTKALTALPAFYKQLSAIRDAGLSGLNPYTANMVGKELTYHLGREMDMSASFAADQGRQAYVAGLNGKLQDLQQDTIANRRDPQKVQQGVAQMNTIAQQLGEFRGLPDEAIDHEKRQLLSGTYSGMVRTAMDEDMINGTNNGELLLNRYKDQINERDFGGLELGLYRMSLKREGEGIQVNLGLNNQQQDLNYAAGGPGVVPVKGAVAPQDVRSAEAAVPGSSAGLGQQRLDQRKVAAVREKWETIDKDPAQYVFKAAPQMGDLLQGAMKDPTKVQPYIDAMDNAYNSLGVAQGDRHYLPQAVAQNLSLNLEKNPEGAPDTLKQMSQQWGSQFPKIYQDMVTLGKLPPAYQAVGTIQDPASAFRLAKMLGDSIKANKAASDFLDPDVVKGIKNGVRTDGQVQKFTQSMYDSGANTSEVDGWLQSIDTLAIANHLQGAGTTDDAVKAVVGNYDYYNHARLPAGKLPQAEINAETALKTISPDTIQYPKALGTVPGMATPENYVAQLRANPTWITTQDGAGMILRDPYGKTVLQKDGSPIRVNFQ